MKAHAERLLGLSKDLILTGGLDGYFKKANAAWTQLLGWAPEDLGRRPLLEYFHPEDRALMAQHLQRIASGEEMHDFESRIQTSSGKHLWMSWSGAFDRERSVFVAIGKNVHRQKEHQDFSKLFFETAPVGLNLCTLDGTWLESNPSFLSMIGYTREEADGGLTYWQLTPRKYDEMERLQLERLQKEGKYGPYEKEFIRKDGSLVPVRLNGFIIRKHGQPFIWSIIEDISKETLLKKEIEAKTILFEAIVENVPNPLFLKDVQNNFQFTLWNKAAEQVFQVPREAVIGKTAHELWPKEHADGYLADDQQVAKESALVDIAEEPFHVTDGSTIFLHTKKVPLKLSNDSNESGARLLLCISEDITKRKELEGDLRAAIEVRDDFLSIASHELKTPVTALSLQLQLLDQLMSKETPSPNERVAAIVKKALVACRRMIGLLGELFDITRIRTGKLTLDKRSVDLKSSIESLVSAMSEEILKSGSKIRISAEEPVLGRWDPNRINQVMSNLLSNALKYGEGKPIDVTVRTDERARSAIVTVRDRGMGIVPELHQAVFQRFERAGTGENFSGLGLGLYVVRQVVEAHGGSIRVESAPGEGSLFIVELPLEDDRGERGEVPR